MFRVDGTVVSFLSELSNTESVQVFSAVVLGLGGARANMWADGRMECLALEIVFATRRELVALVSDINNSTWMSLEAQLERSRQDIDISVAIAPHKMRMSSDELEAAAAGTGERANIMLLAWAYGERYPEVLGWAYHTTNVPQSTTSTRRGQVYGKSRILWHHNFPLHDITNKAAVTLANQLHVAAPTLDTELLDHAPLGDSVFRQYPAVVTPPDETTGSLHTSESDPHNSQSDNDIDF